MKEIKTRLRLSHVLRGRELSGASQWEAAVTLLNCEADKIRASMEKGEEALNRVARKVCLCFRIRALLELHAERLSISCQESGFWKEMDGAIGVVRQLIAKACEEGRAIGFDEAVQHRLKEAGIIE